MLTDIIVKRDKQYQPQPSSPQSQPQQSSSPPQQQQQSPSPSSPHPLLTVPSQLALSPVLNEEEQLFLVVDGSGNSDNGGNEGEGGSGNEDR